MGKVKTLRLSIKPLKQSPRKVYVYLPNDTMKKEVKNMMSYICLMVTICF